MAKKKAAKKTPDLSYIAEDLRPLAVPISSIEPDPRNARTHNSNNIRAIRASLREFGQRKPLVVNSRNKEVEAGNGTLLAARALKWTHVAVVWVEDDPAAQSGFAVADNRTSELAAWDDALLADLIGEIRDDAPDLFDDLLLSDLLDDEEENHGPPPDVPDSISFRVVAECKNEAEQQKLYKQLTRQNYKCKLVLDA